MVASTNNKSGFTIIELSIVLILVSTLLVVTLSFQKIKEMSTMHTILKEQQKIKADIAIFYTLFGEWPGNITEERCMQNASFRANLFNGSTISLCSSVNNITAMDCRGNIVSNGIGGGYASCSLCDTIAGSGTRAAIVYAMRQIDILSDDLSVRDKNAIYTDSGYVTYNDVLYFYIPSRSIDANYWTLSSNNEFRGQRLEALTTNTNVSKVFYNKPQLSLFNNAPISCVGDAAGCDAAIGAVSSIMAFNIDTKIDDGLPYNGYVVGWKPGYVQTNVSLTGSEISLYCNTLGEQLTTGNLSNITNQKLLNARYTTRVNGNNNINKGCNLSFAFSR